MNMYTCPMHKEVTSDKAGVCPKCGMTLVKKEMKMDHNKMSFWEKLKMSMTMSMGMDHTGLAGREMAKMMEEDIRNKFFVSLFLTIPIVALTYIPISFNKSWLLLILTTPVYFYCGWIFLYSSYIAIKQRTLNMAVLIAVGITAAYLFSIVLTLLGSSESFYEASAMLTTFVLFGHWMEMKSRRGTTDALQALFNLVPPQARVIRNGKEIMISTSEVKVGDIILLKPGDKVPVDGKITEGESAIDESLVTGESIPVFKVKGDLVIGGSLNTSGSVKFMATKIGEDTALAQIVKMVETAQNSKAPGQKIADRFAKYLVIVAVGGGLVTFMVWYFIIGESLIFALTFAISTVVIACPDALGLATPTAVAVGTGLGAKHNILIKDAPTLEQVSKIQAIVLDKTGTLTEGKPKITDIVTTNNFSEDEILELAGSVEAKSGHPLSKSILERIDSDKLKLHEVKKFNSISGHGVEAVVNNKNILIGTIKLMNDRGVDIKPINVDLDRLLNEGKTIMIIAVGEKIAGVIAVSDLVKKTSLTAVTKMKELGLEVAMITGDNKKTAEIIAKSLGIERVFSEVLPEQKEQYVKKLQSEGKFTAMVGDGVNDAPALARADIGIAIGAGTDVAIETANVVLMKSDPMDILRAIVLSKATVRKMKENLVWASIYNLLAIPVAAGILYPNFGITLRPEFSALLMSISSIIVAVNAVSLKRVEVKLNI
ncbi:MAG: hypothetical protein ACD_19C00017G0009 [uncultured bacterium]|nr:MAG: hypothetical protein ACD_19C00017G0009 [uncultured bacterium]